MAGLMLEGKVILVTGSTTGIGEATARRCSAEGAKVMVHGRDEARAGALIADLGENAAYVLGDLGDPAACERVVDATVERFGASTASPTTRLDVAQPYRGNGCREVRPHDRGEHRAPLLIIRRALPTFRKLGGGAVVNIGSVSTAGGRSLSAALFCLEGRTCHDEPQPCQCACRGGRAHQPSQRGVGDFAQ